MCGSPESLMCEDAPIVSLIISTDLKRCSKCGETKPINEFYKNKSQKCGLDSECKLCGYNRRVKRKPYQKAYRQTHKEESVAYSRIYRKANREKAIAYSRDYYKANKEKMNALSRAYEAANKEKMNAYRLAYVNNLSRNDPMYRLSQSVSSGVYRSLKDNKAGRHWEELVGFTITELKARLESLFTEGMAWDNYGEWHVDHKIPISAHNYERPEDYDFNRCWALKNLQPMWGKDNIKKSNNLTKDFQPSLAF